MAPNRKRAAIYLRVSTNMQDAATQRPQVEEMLRARGFDVVAVYEDTESGGVRHRPGLDRCLLDARRRQSFDVIGVAALDRLHRSMSGCLDTVLQLDRIGVGLLSCREPWLDLGDSPVRGLLIALCGWVGEMELRAVRSRTLAGLARAKAAGKVLGRPKAVFDLEAARKMRMNGAGLRTIAKSVGVGATTVARYLKADDLLRHDGPRDERVDEDDDACAENGGLDSPPQVRESTLAA